MFSGIFAIGWTLLSDAFLRFRRHTQSFAQPTSSHF